jgi:hypothetical protein
LRTVQYSQEDDLFSLNFVNRDKRQGRENQLARALDTPQSATIWKCAESAHRFRDVVSNAMGDSRTIACNVVADPFEIVRGIRRPPDAHQLR